MLNRFKHVFIILLVFVFVCKGHSADRNGVYLSYDLKVIFNYVLALKGATPEKQKQILIKLKEYLILVRTEAIEGFDNVRNFKEIKNFNEFFDRFTGDFPDTHSVDVNLKIIESKPRPDTILGKVNSSRVQKQIQDFMQHQYEFYDRFYKEKNIDPKNIRQQMLELSLNEWPMLLNLITNSDLNVLEYIVLGRVVPWAEALLDREFEHISDIAKEIVKTKFTQKSDPGFEIFMNIVLENYFKLVDSNTKKTIISAFLNRNLELTPLEKFEILIQNMGPSFQKFMQVMAKNKNVDSELQVIFKKLQKSVKLVPWDVVKQILIEERGNFTFTYFERKPLGVGSMAQAHRAKILVDGISNNVVVRFLKPEMDVRINEDQRILTKIAKILDSHPYFIHISAPKMTPVVDDIIKTTRAELNLSETIDRQILGSQAYTKDYFMDSKEFKIPVHVRVPKIYKSKSNNSRFMVQELIFGENLENTFKKWGEVAPQLQIKLSEIIAEMWIKELIFGSGFYHSDLHAENFLVDLHESRIQINIIDFGMGGTISSEFQERLIALSAAIEINSTQVIAKIYWEMSVKDKNQISYNKLRDAIETEINSKRMNSMNELTLFVAKQGLQLPYEFISLNRGIAIIDELLESSGSKLNASTIAKNLSIKNIQKLNKSLSRPGEFSLKDKLKLGIGELRSNSTTTQKTSVSCDRLF